MSRANILSSIALGLLLFACGSESAASDPDAASGADSGVDLADAGPEDADVTPDPDADLSPDAGPANGSECTVADECGSGVCSNIPFLGGQCGECAGDEDCTSGGCTLQNPYSDVGSTCNAGAAGDGCENSDVCQGDMICGQVINLLGLVEVNTCGACETDADCTNGAAPSCTPIFDTTTFTGQKFCLANDSLALNDFCEFDGNGDAHCASNHCSPVDGAGIVEVGACGECNLDNNAGCLEGETCVAGSYDFVGTGALTGSTCQ